MTEADTCREFVTLKLVAAGWGRSESVIGERHSFTNGRIIVAGGKVRRGKQRRAGDLLYYRRDMPPAVVEAKEVGLPAETGVQPARECAEMLGLKFAYATHGHRIIEIDYVAGTEREVDRYASPQELWQRLTQSTPIAESATAHLLEPFNRVSGKVPRYYQRTAIQRVIEAILLGQTRILARLATGTGKTCVAFQVCWKLWNSRWNRMGEYRRPKIHPSQVTAGVLAYYLSSEEGLEQVGLASPGTADRNRTLSPGNLGGINVPVPVLADQQTFGRLQAEVKALKAKHTAIREASATLLSATLERIFPTEATA